jgi:excisionase family DNA binding protein
MDRLLLNVGEVADQLGVCKATAYALIGKGELPHVRIGTRIGVPAEAVRAWVTRQAPAAEALNPSAAKSR